MRDHRESYSKTPPQKLVKMTREDEEKLNEMTHALVSYQRSIHGELLGHQLATTSHLVRFLIRRAYEEFKAVEEGRLAETGLIHGSLSFGGMRDPEPQGGYLGPHQLW